MAGSSPTVPCASGIPKVSFSSAEHAPIRSVVVYMKNKAEITRVLSFSANKLGLHEVELTGLPGGFSIEERSVAVKGSGQCTILDVSFSDNLVGGGASPGSTADDPSAMLAERGKLLKEVQDLQDEHSVLSQQYTRSQGIRQLADRVVDGVTFFFPTGVVGAPTPTPGAEAATSAPAMPLPLDFDRLSKALDWWVEKAADADKELHRTEVEGRRVINAIGMRNMILHRGAHENGPRTIAKSQARIAVTLDVREIDSTIELEMRYMIHGATWSPAYDLRVDTQTDSISCTHYGRVSQKTSEDWEGVTLTLSTADPTVRATPPPLGINTVSLKAAPSATANPAQPQMSAKQCIYGPIPGSTGSLGAPPPPDGSFQPWQFVGAGQFSAGGATPSAPAPPPAATVAVAGVEGGGGGSGVGPMSFVVENPAIVRGNGQEKKLAVGGFQLSSEVFHYVVPSKEPAAYLQAKVTNNTEYLLLASDDVSVFFDNTFVTKTSLASVSPGDTFETFLGVDHAVEIQVAQPRMTSMTQGLFGNMEHVTHTRSTSISNEKRVPVTCVVVDTMPLPTDETIKVSLHEPAPETVRDWFSLTNEKLPAAALEMFGEVARGPNILGGEGSTSDDTNYTSSEAASPVQTATAGVLKTGSNHLAWVATIAPQENIQISLQYSMQWPTDKEIQFNG